MPLVNLIYVRAIRFIFACLLCAQGTVAAPVISEFLAGNDSGLIDGDGGREDWIEIYNPDSVPVDLSGWHLSTRTNDLQQWTFPSIILAPGDFLVVMASGKDDSDYFDGVYWHTTFRLALEGEYLALVAPDGTNVVSEFSPAYPPQVTDVSYGQLWMEGSGESNLTFASTARVFVPSDDGLGTTWTTAGFVPDASWQISPGPGVGFDTDTTNASASVVAAWGFDEADGATAIDDASGNSHSGAVRAGVVFGGTGANANTGTSATLNNSSIDVEYDPDLNPESFAFAAWVRPQSGGSGYRSVVTSRMDDGASVRGYIIYINPSNQWQFWTGAGGAPGSWNVLTGPAVSFDQWVHVAISWDENTSTKTLYIDGAIAAQTAAQGYVPNAGRDLHIGAGDDFGNSFRWLGDIDDAALWNEAVDIAVLDAHRADGISAITAISFGGLIDLDMEGDMLGQFPGAYLRLPFMVNDPSVFDHLSLNLHFDDGFAAYLNGVPIVSTNAPLNASWNNVATVLREDSYALEEDRFNQNGALELLTPGANVLAIHGLNRDASEPDFLIRPRLVGTIQGAPSTSTGYLDPPTPAGINPVDSLQPGPEVVEVTHTPIQPDEGQTLTVDAVVLPRLAAVNTVSLYWRLNYGPESSVAMVNTTGHVYEAVINGFASGDLVRWRVEAGDAEGGTSRSPAYLDTEGKNQSAEYFGTMVRQTNITSLLPIMYWWTDDVPNSETRTGSRASVFYLGRYYDNIFVRLRGGFTSTGSQKFDFNKGDPVYVNEKLGSVGELNLNTAGRDNTFVRQPLAFQMYEVAQSAACESFNVLLVRNGSLQRVAMLIEQVDEDFLDRFGFDEEGALYKFVQRSNLNPMLNDTITGVEKKTRTFEDFTDLDDFIDAIRNGTLPERQLELFDRVDLPRFTNFMAAKTIVRDVDSIRKNLYMYRDTRGSGEWTIFPWDEDFTFGNTNPGTYANHPLLGDQDHKLACCDQWNVLYDLYNKTPRALEMYGRRLRTLMDQMLGPPGTPVDATIIEQRADELIALVQPHTGTSSTNIKSWVPSWRNNLNNNFGPDDPEAIVPDALVSPPSIHFGAIDFNPVDGQDAEYVELRNGDPSNAVDLTGWVLDGGVSFDFVPGTVIPADSSVFVSPDRSAFRSRTTGPTGGEGRFVIGDYRGHLSNYGEPLILLDDMGATMASITYTGQLTAAQEFLVISEIMHNPTQHPDAEYVELLNISASQTLDIGGVAFAEGVHFTFPTNTFLGPGERVLVVKDPIQFATNLNIAGVFENDTRLDSKGERIKLEDATGSTVHEFDYRNTSPWPGGEGLVLIAPYTKPDHGIGYHWRSDASTPGTTDGYLAVGPTGVNVWVHGGMEVRYATDMLAENVTHTLEWSTNLADWFPADARFSFVELDASGTFSWSLDMVEDAPIYVRVRSSTP